MSEVHGLRSPESDGGLSVVSRLAAAGVLPPIPRRRSLGSFTREATRPEEAAEAATQRTGHGHSAPTQAVKATRDHTLFH